MARAKPKTAKPDQPWSLTRTDQNAHQFRCDLFTNELRILLLSDVHLDNALCDRKILKRHLDQALTSGSPVFFGGDFYDAMQGKKDRRSCSREADPRHMQEDYFDQLIDDGLEFLTPYAPVIAMFNYGNHETSVLKHNHTDLIQRTVQGLRQKGSPVVAGQYDGFVHFLFNTKKNCFSSKFLYYHHGYGGGGPITQGVIDNSRTRSAVVADVYWSGHIHQRNDCENIIETCNRFGKTELRQQIFLRTSTYKREGHKGTMGFHKEGGRANRPVGGWWLHFSRGWQINEKSGESDPIVYMSSQRTDGF